MVRPVNPVPTYRLHKKTGRAIVTVRDHSGARRDILLPGPHGSAESLEEYARLTARLRTSGGRLPPDRAGASDLTLAELTLRYMEFVTGYYVHPSGAPTSEQVTIRHALRPLNRLYGSLPVAEFDCVKLELVRDAMISGSWMNPAEVARREKQKLPAGWARGPINKHVHRIRQMFRWGLTKKLVPAAVLVELQAVRGLKRGRSEARETDPVRPVDVAVVEQTLPCCPPVVRDMVRVQLMTGARPGEVCSMTVRNLDMNGPVWTYRPDRHKTQHRGHERTIAIGPKAQAVLRAYIKPNLDVNLFSPAEQKAIINAEKRAKRKSKVPPSQVSRSKSGATRKPRDLFTVTAYNRAVRRACERAGVPYWHVHMLRHTAALTIEREFGLEASRAALGHKSVDMTAMYSGLDLKRAKDVAAKIG